MKISTGMSHVVLPANTYIFFFSFPKYILLIDIVSYPFENLIELNTNRWACLFENVCCGYRTGQDSASDKMKQSWLKS